MAKIDESSRIKSRLCDQVGATAPIIANRPPPVFGTVAIGMNWAQPKKPLVVVEVNSMPLFGKKKTPAEIASAMAGAFNEWQRGKLSKDKYLRQLESLAKDTDDPSLSGNSVFNA